MDISHSVDTFDAVIIGGGPAGLSAAINLARACRSVAVFECGRPGRSDWAQVNHNYLGFPDGIPIVELDARGRRQAERFGVRFIESEVTSVTQVAGGFKACAPRTTVQARAVVLATGVADRWVTFPGYEDYIGRSMHWCIACDGYEMQGQRVVIAGNDEDTAEMAMQMLIFTAQVSIVTNSGSLGLRPVTVEALEKRGIRLVVGRIASARARSRGYVDALLLEGGEEIGLDHLFSAQGADPNTALARALGVELTAEGYVKVDVEGRTSRAGVFAAGDVTRLYSHQIVTAAHEGAMAANSLNYHLYEQDQR
ncbi:MAG: NAD(P)/FAD-dependent oxidoreductase [Chloroflexota bacterium]|nr:NAD(P)/FAD-dependent oxidoreductase [Chloroflexota bacterium]